MSAGEDGRTASLLDALGIQPYYYDIKGKRHDAPAESIAALMRALGIDDPDAALNELSKRPWNTFIDPAIVVSVNAQPGLIPLHFQLDEGTEAEVSIKWRTSDEQGSVEEFIENSIGVAADAVIGGQRYVRVDLHNRTDHSLGYYWLDVECKTKRRTHHGRCRLIVAPDRCHLPQRPMWGVSAALYGMRTERDWGIGDLGSLAEMTHLVGTELGGGFVGINPLHAISDHMPYGISPYSSISRLYRNPIYIDVERVMAICGIEMSGELRLRVEGLRKTDMVDYDAVIELKSEVLQSCFERFSEVRPKEHYEDFERYVLSEDVELENHAVFMALTDVMRILNPNAYTWRQWPEQYSSPTAPGIRDFKRLHERKIAFCKFQQWVLDRQLRDAAPSGMQLGIYNDLAVGSSADGSDAWAYQGVFVSGLSAGAPPDETNMNGQCWGFPPLLPSGLRESGYELFIQTIRRNLAHAGALRIDHAIGLFRIFCIPEGMNPAEGVYLRYPSEDLLRIIALESVRAGAVIIAEDLGTMSDDIREALLRFGMLSYRLFYFERDWQTGTFLRPDQYPELALATVTTHDLPTLYGYWAGHDIEVKAGLGIYPNEESRLHDIEDRARVRQAMLDAVADRLPEGYPRDAASLPEMTPELCRAIYSHLAATPSLLVSVSIDDALGVMDQQNMPGTLNEHPNWRRRLPMSVSRIGSESELRELAGILNRG